MTELQPQERLCPFLCPHTTLVAPWGLLGNGNWEDGLPREPLDSGDMVGTGCRDLLLLTHPPLQQAEVTAVPCAGKRMPWEPLCALCCLLFLSAWHSPCQAWHGQHTSWALRWAQNILHEQHVTLQGSLCPQQGLVAAGGSPKARLSQVPAGPQAVPQAGSSPSPAPASSLSLQVQHNPSP